MAFVVSQGAVELVQRPLVPAAPVLGLQLADNVFADYATIWRSQQNVRTVVDFLARNVAQLPIRVYRRVSDTDRERLPDHPLATLLGRPNFYTTRYRLVDSLIHDLCIYDNAFWVKVRPDDAPAGLLRLDPRMVSPLGASFLNPDMYLVRGVGGYLELPPSQLVHFRGYNPHNPSWGCSPIETLRRILAEEFEAARYREQLWRNSARMSGYISRPADAPLWSKPDRDRFRDQWQAQYAADGPRAGGTPILEDGMSYTAAAVTPEQAQYLESRKLTREEVASAYHVPLPMVGILDHANFSNVVQLHEMLYQDTLGPWMQQLSEEIELQLLPDFADRQGVYVEFDITAKLAGSFEEQASVLQAATGAPYMTRNEARARLNLPELDDGDGLVTPLNVLIGGQASPQLAPKVRRVECKARPPQAEVDRYTAALSGFFARQHAALASRLGGAKATPAIDDVWDDGRWDNELAGDLYALAVPLAALVAAAVLAKLGLPSTFDEARTHHWLYAWASVAARGINATSKAAVAEVLDHSEHIVADVKALYDTYGQARAEEIAQSQTTALAGFGSEEAVQQTGLDGTKTWRVTSKRPRTSHAAIDGETVGVDEKFSNGARWPGDHALPLSERARCSCEVVMSVSTEEPASS